MQADTMRTLSEYIHELRRRDRHYHGTDSGAAFDTTTEDDAHWNPGDSSGDAGRGTDSRG